MDDDGGWGRRKAELVAAADRGVARALDRETSGEEDWTPDRMLEEVAAKYGLHVGWIGREAPDGEWEVVGIEYRKGGPDGNLVYVRTWDGEEDESAE